MVSTCTVPGCKDHRRKRHAGISYYRFPVKDAERCKLWLRAIKNAKYAENTPVASLRNLRVCSLHFRIEDFERHLVPSITGDEGGKRLRNTAVPTLNLEIRDDEQPGTSAQPSLATRSETVPHAITAVSTATAALTTSVSAVTVGTKDDEEPLPSSARPPPTKRPHKEAPHTVTAVSTAYVGMKERAPIAILEHNENIVKREQATTRAGEPQFKQRYCKKSKRWILKKVFRPYTTHFTEKLVEFVLEHRRDPKVQFKASTSLQLPQPALPPNIAPVL